MNGAPGKGALFFSIPVKKGVLDPGLEDHYDRFPGGTGMRFEPADFKRF